MYDLKLNNSGDLEISDTGDVVLTQSVRQAVQIRLRWLFGEWRFTPEAGVPYFERIMVKKPDIEGVKQILRTEIMAVDGMTDVKNLEVSIDSKSRVATITFDGTADGENFSEEVLISA
jgi:hypothetical protein